MMLFVFDALRLLAPVLASMPASSDSEGGVWLLLLIGPAGASGVYYGLYRYYRNTDKSHSFEQETLIAAQPVTGQDQKVDAIHGTQRTSINGNNARNHRARVQRLQ